MSMWGLNKGKSSKKRSINSDLDLESIGFESDNNSISNSNSTSLPSERKVKSFHDYDKNEIDYYGDILNEMEPDSKVNMAKRAISLGLPTSFVVGYFDIDEEEARLVDLGNGELIIMNKHVFMKKIMEKVLIISTDDTSVEYLRNIVGDRNIILVQNVDSLILEMENDSKELTILLTNKLPVDIEQNIDLLINHLEAIEGVHFVEVGTKGYFKNSLKINDFSDIDTGELTERDITREEIEEKLVGNDSNNHVEDSSRFDETKGKVDSIENDFNNNLENKIETNEEKLDIKNKKADTINDSFSEPKINKNELHSGSSTSILETEIMLEEKNKLNSKIEELGIELSSYKKLYAEKSNELDEALIKINSLNEDLTKMDNLINNDLSNKEKELQEQLTKARDEVIQKDSELRSLKAVVNNLESDLKDLRIKYSNVEIDIAAQKELIKDKIYEIDTLNSTIEAITKEKYDLNSQIEELKENMIEPALLEEFKEKVIQKEVEIDNLTEQVRILRIEARKEIEEKSIVQEELSKMQESYKELLSSSEQSTKLLDEKFLEEEINTQVFYYKIIHQPPYFKSFINTFIELLSKKEKVLTVIIRENDELSDIYFKGIKRVSTLEEVSESDKLVWVKPSKLMFVDDIDFYNRYDYMVILDYLPTKKRYIKGDNVTPIHVLMSETEKEALGVKGLILSGGEQSIVDLRYDKKFELAKTPFVKKAYIEKKVKVWLATMGLIKLT